MSLADVKSELDLILNSVDEGIILYDDRLEPIQANAALPHNLWNDRKQQAHAQRPCPP